MKARSPRYLEVSIIDPYYRVVLATWSACEEDAYSICKIEKRGIH